MRQLLHVGGTRFIGVSDIQGEEAYDIPCDVDVREWCERHHTFLLLYDNWIVDFF
jgi:hypothetical protein